LAKDQNAKKYGKVKQSKAIQTRQDKRVGQKRQTKIDKPIHIIKTNQGREGERGRNKM